MKLVRIAGAVAALVLFLNPVPAYSQHEHGRGDGQDRGRPRDQQGRSDRQSGNDKQRGKPREGQRGEAARPRSSDEGRASSPAHERNEGPSHGRSVESPRQTERRERVERVPDRRFSHPRSEEQARAWQRQRGWQRPGAWLEHRTWTEHRAERWDRDHRTWMQRGGYGGYYIPTHHFELYFGPSHFFRIRQRPIIVTGYPRFRYRDYWFMLVDPWPEFWASEWYMTDDVYIDYDDGYYLYNRRHPGVALAVSVVF